MNNLIYLVYGDRAHYYKQGRFSIESALRLTRPNEDLNVSVFTSHPDAFANLPVDVIPITDEKLTEWAGEGQYHHRAKICVMREALKELGGRVVLVDTDTVFRLPPVLLFERLQRGAALMHEFEKDVQKSCPNIARDLQALTVALDSGAEWRLDEHTIMWNSGVVGLRAEDVKLVDDALVLVDAFRSASNIFVLEQVAFTESLRRKLRIIATDDVVYHYYGPRFDFADSQIDHFLQNDIDGDKFYFGIKRQSSLRRALLKTSFLIRGIPSPEAKMLLALDILKRAPTSLVEASQRAAWEKFAFRTAERLGTKLTQFSKRQLSAYREKISSSTES